MPLAERPLTSCHGCGCVIGEARVIGALCAAEPYGLKGTEPLLLCEYICEVLWPLLLPVAVDVSGRTTGVEFFSWGAIWEEVVVT